MLTASPASPEIPSGTHAEALPTQPGTAQSTGFGFGDEFLSSDAFGRLFTAHPTDTAPEEASPNQPAAPMRADESPDVLFANDGHPAWLISALGQSGIRDIVAPRTEAPRSGHNPYSADDVFRRPATSDSSA